jgi:hypothetical protein
VIGVKVLLGVVWRGFLAHHRRVDVVTKDFGGDDSSGEVEEPRLLDIGADVWIVTNVSHQTEP